VPAKTLTLILSLWQRERRALELDRLHDTCAQNRSALKARFSPATNSVQCAIETHFQRLLHGNLNSP